jgi:AcrR family transcriptional regulator
MEVFWERGFEGTSLDDLLEAMQISPSSLYAVFGSKERLFLEVIDCYLAGPGSFIPPILREPLSTQQTFERLLEVAADELTRTDQPAGCMVSLAMTHGSPGATFLRQSLTERRTGSLHALQGRIEQGVAAGELPGDTDAQDLARFFMILLQGMSVQARDGASRENLLAIGRTAMRAWPV